MDILKVALIGFILLVVLILLCRKRRSVRIQAPSTLDSNCGACGIDTNNVGYKQVQNLSRMPYIQWPPMKGDTKFGNPPGKIIPMEQTNLLNRYYDNVADQDGYNNMNNPYFNLTTMNDTYMFAPRGYKQYLKDMLPRA